MGPLEACRLPLRTIDVDSLFRAMDPKGRGEVEWRWFLAATMRASKAGLENGAPTLTDAFMLLDRDGDGYIDVDDIAALFEASPVEGQPAAGREEISSMMEAAAPQGGDGGVVRLTQEDFQRMMLLPSMGSLSGGVQRAVRRSGADGADGTA